MKQTKPTNRELEAEKIAIEKQAKVMWSGMASGDADAYMQKVREERRLNWAENEDLAEQIKYYAQKKPNQKDPNALNTGLPVVVGAIAGAVIGGALATSGALEPNFLASDVNDIIGVTFAGMAAGGIAEFINACAYCTKPITRFVYDRQVAKRQRKIAANNRRNNAITYLEECLKKEEAESSDEFTDEDYMKALANTVGEVDGQLSFDEDEFVGHA